MLEALHCRRGPEFGQECSRGEPPGCQCPPRAASGQTQQEEKEWGKFVLGRHVDVWKYVTMWFTIEAVGRLQHNLSIAAPKGQVIP